MPSVTLTPANDTNGGGHERTGAARSDHEDSGISGNALVTGFVDATGGQERAEGLTAYGS